MQDRHQVLMPIDVRGLMTHRGGGESRHTALSDQGSHPPYILHDVYYMKDRESRAAVLSIPERGRLAPLLYRPTCRCRCSCRCPCCPCCHPYARLYARPCCERRGGPETITERAPTPPAGSQHSCQPTVKLYILPLVWGFSSGEGVVRGRRGQQLEFAAGI